MHIRRSINKALRRLGALLTMTTLAACGGGSEEETGCSAVIAVVTAGLGCLGTVTVTSPPPPPPPPPSSNIVRMSFHVEYEPNNTLDNANPVSFRSAAPEEHIGIDITGAVNQDDDQADFFIFTPPRSGQFLVYLCTDTCADSLQSDQVYLSVYDQGQTTIVSTPVGTVETQRLSVDLVAGLAYYVEVNGYNTGPTAKDYKLVIID
jgi:hypothetical protein